MARRYYKLIVEVDDTPEVDGDGHITTPGVPVVVDCRRLGFMERLRHILNKAGRRHSGGMIAEEAVMEIPKSVNAHELFDYHPASGVRCHVHHQEKCSDSSVIEV